MKTALTFIMIFISITIGASAYPTEPPRWFTQQRPYSNDCGVATTVSAINWKTNRNYNISTVRRHIPYSYWRLNDIYRTINIYTPAKFVTIRNKNDILYHLKHRKHIIINVDMTRTRYSRVYSFGKNYHTVWFKWNHFLTISGYKYINGELYFIIQDSWKRYSFNVKYKPETLIHMMITSSSIVI